ncbi:hypothetical protein L6251_00305, partial [Candidatus Parcubacteria bacterium]|nr:hypothetical protein [Patescibacteria group bacterium]MCG2698856.1 hypothetical protein [Candidatus Parcubacteria bacterium]
RILFEKKYVVACDNVFENKEARNFVKKNIGAIAGSPNIFIFLEADLDAEFLELFKKLAEKIQEFPLLTGLKLRKWVKEKAGEIPFALQEEIIKNCGSDLWRASKEIEKYELGMIGAASNQGATLIGVIGKYNLFAICDAVAERNKGKAWVSFQEGILSGILPEEIFYKVVWEVKNLLMIKKLQSAGVKNLEKETGLHPFVAKKALVGARNFTEEELRGHSFGLVNLYHDVRSGRAEFQIGLEKFLLRI